MGRIVSRVKIKNYDEGEDIFYRARATDLKLKDGSSSITYDTPTRICTQSELKAKAEIPSSVPITSPIGIVDYRLNAKDIDSLFTNSGWHRKLTQLRLINNRFVHFPLRTCLIQPTSSTSKSNLETGMEFLQKEGYRSKFLRKAYELTLSAGFNSFAIPYLDIPSEDLKDIYTKFFNGFLLDSNFQEHKSIQIDTIEIIPVIDLKREKDLLDIINFLKNNYISTGRMKVLGLIYRPYKISSESHDIIWNALKDSEISIILIGVERRLGDYDDISGLHCESFILGDTFSMKTGRGGKPKLGDTVVNNLRFFLKDNLEISTIKNITDKKKYTNILSDFSEVFSKDYPYVLNAIENRKEAKNDIDKLLNLAYISKVHETISSTNEFENEKNFILGNELTEYLDEKELLRTSIKKLMPI